MTGKLLDKAQIWERNIYRDGAAPVLIAEIDQNKVGAYLGDVARAHNARKFKNPEWHFGTHTKYTLCGWRRIAEDICARSLGVVAVRREGEPSQKISFLEEERQRPGLPRCMCVAGGE